MSALENLLPEWQRLRAWGQRVALITLIRSTGASPRPLGSQMLIAENGQSAGYLTGGCAEGVIIAEAQAALTARRNRVLTLGPGSPYLDIRLPCGAGVELYIDVGVEDEVIATLQLTLAQRTRVAMDTDLDTGRHRIVRELGASLPVGHYRRWFFPRRCLLVIGTGPNVPALAQLASVSDFEVHIMAPDQATCEAAAMYAGDCARLTTPAAFCCPAMDPWTAAVTLFHDHDWEPAILSQLLRSDCFYLGALGSRNTHAARLAQLEEMGHSNASARLHGPVGLAINAKSPPEIAISILAEVIATYRRHDLPLLVRD